MKIEQLLRAVNEGMFDTVTANSALGRAQAAAQEKAATDAANKEKAGANAFGSMAQNLRVVPGGKNTGDTTQPTTTTAQPAPAGTTGDPVLDQPLNPAAPKQPGTTLAQKVGGFAKGVGAVAGGVAGIGRAVKKGYAAGANAVGGPGATSVGTTAPIAPTNTPQPDQSDEIAQLRSQLQAMQQKLTRAGIQQ
jgi:hypothetical protein